MKKLFLILFSSILMFSAQANVLQDIFGNAETGDSCASDYECQSLCCNANTGVCARHEPHSNTPVLCNKAEGETCITSEFCQSYDIVIGKIVKKTLANGQSSCEVRYYQAKASGSCVSKTCHPPQQPPAPVIDWTSPNPCASAVYP